MPSGLSLRRRATFPPHLRGGAAMGMGGGMSMGRGLVAGEEDETLLLDDGVVGL